MKAQATTASTGPARVGLAASTPNELLVAIELQDWAAADAAPLRVWREAQSIASGFHHAQWCAMMRGDEIARRVQLELMNRWAAVECQAIWLDAEAGLVRL